MKKTILLATGMIFIICVNVSAQRNATKRGSSSTNSSNYTTALGVKFLDGAGLTVKHFVNEKAAIEAIGYFWNRGARFLVRSGQARCDCSR